MSHQDQAATLDRSFFQGENLTNSQYDIARTPTVNLGQPILARIGLRWQSRR